MVELTDKGRRFLTYMNQLQDERLFNHGWRARVDEILKNGSYSYEDKWWLNEISIAYSQWQETGIIPENYVW